VAVEVIGVADLDTQVDKLRHTRSSLRARQVSETRQHESSGLKLAELVDLEEIDPVIAGIHAAAQRNGVRLEQGEYRLQAEPGTRLARYRIVFPAKGGYLQLRGWLDEAILTRPGLALDELTLRREDIGNEVLEARVSLGLLVRQP
jgi:hypothetical protein